MNTHTFVFNDFQENTYIIYDESGEAAIIDPGCNNDFEIEELEIFISENNLKPKYLLLTHGHIDHILGVKYISSKYGLKTHMNKNDAFLLETADQIANYYGIFFNGINKDFTDIDDSTVFRLGNEKINCIHVPGHSPGSICFYNPENKILIAGDVLFHSGIGRTDLPGGNYDQLINGIKNKLFNLPENVKVFPGHGIKTSIKFEKVNNPFF